MYEGLGAKVEEISLPHSAYAIATYYLVATAEASSNLARYDGVHYGHRSSGHRNLIDQYKRSRGEGFGARLALDGLILTKLDGDSRGGAALAIRAAQRGARVTAITHGEATANVELDANGMRLVASITTEAVRDLGIEVGSEVTAIVKASDVLLGIG